MTQLAVTALFQPMLSGVGAATTPAAPGTPNTWYGLELQYAAQFGLPTTSWQAGAPERTIFATEAVNFALSDVKVAQRAQGGFLQTAALGSVTYTLPNGTQTTIPVTPDPSNAAQNPTGALGWQDFLSQSLYLVTRLQQTFAQGPLAIANLTVSSKGPYSPGTYHAGNAQNPATYHNETSLTIPSSIIAGSGGVVAAVTTGLTSTIIQTGAAHGLAVNDVVYILIPTSSQVSGLAGIFAIVTGVTSLTFAIAVGSSGAWVGGGNVYLCTVATMIADAPGTSSNAAPGAASIAVTQNAGVFVGNVVGWAGSNWESNPAYMSRTLLSLASRSPNGPSQAYVYFAETAQALLLAATPSYALTNGPVVANEFLNAQTGVVTTVAASATPASTTLGANITPGVSQLPISGVTNANPCVVTCTGPTSLAPGGSMTVTISGVLGTGGVNGTFLGTYVGANSFSIPVNTTSTGSYTGGGSVEGGDLGQIDQLLQQKVVPSNTPAITQSALALPISIAATVTVPVANVAQYQLAVGPQLSAQIASYPLGGSAADSYDVPYNDIVGALEEAGVVALGQASYATVQSLSLNGGATGAGVAFPSNQYQAIVGTITVSVLGV
jgi:hypothetical protein